MFCLQIHCLKASAPDGARDQERGIAMAGAQEGNTEQEGAGEAGEGLGVCSWSPGTERGHLAS